MKAFPENAYQEITDFTKRVACYAAEIALKVYVDDVKTLVSDAVMQEISPLLQSENHTNRDFARKRAQALARWKDTLFPLAMSPQTVQDLIRAITPQNKEMPDLPMSNLGNQPLSFFVNKLLKVSAQPNDRRKRRQPPFISGGNALPVMRVSISEITKVATDSMLANKDLDNFVYTTIMHTCKCLRIEHIPWCQDSNGRRGNPSMKIHHNLYLCIGGVDAAMPSSTAAYLTQAEASILRVRESSLRIVEDNPAGEWSLLNVGLLRFATMLHKSVLPAECNQKFVSSMNDTALISQTLAWTIERFNPNNNVHKIVLFVGLAVACMLPNVFTEMKNKPDKKSSTDVVERYIRNLPWTTLKRKGLTDQHPFPLMVLSTFMTVYDKSSPIRSDNDVKKQWAAKYCESNVCSSNLITMSENHANHANRIHPHLRVLGVWVTLHHAIIRVGSMRVVELDRLSSIV